MGIEIKMPALSPTMEEGTLAKWLVKEGDEVLGQYRVSKIESGAIELTRPDGSTVRLSLP